MQIATSGNVLNRAIIAFYGGIKYATDFYVAA